MKKYIFLLVVVLSFLGCEKEMMDYEGKDGVYFSVQEAPPSLYGDPEIWAHMDTTLIPFSLLLENDSTVRLKVRVMGDVVNYDRYFTVSVVDSLTTALVNEDYAPLEERYMIAAGERDGFVEFTGFRQAKMLDSTYYVTLQLMENEYFSLPMDVETLGKQGLHERDTECCSSRGGTFRRGFHAEGVDGELFWPLL